MNLPTGDTVSEFLDQLASASATPGGGGAAALSGAQGSALVEMVCHLSLGKPEAQGQDTELQQVLAKAKILRARLTAAIDQDADVFQGLMAAYRLPKDSEPERQQRLQTIQKALLSATESPITTARDCMAVLELSQAAARLASRWVVSDVGVAALVAHAGLKSAALNVWVNVSGLNNAAQAGCWRQELDHLLAEAQPLQDAIYQQIKMRLTG